MSNIDKIDKLDTVKSIISVLRDSLDDGNHQDHVCTLIHLENMLDELMKGKIG